MTNKELVDSLDRLTKLTTATATDIVEGFKIYRLLFGERIHLCNNCSGSVRAAFDNLKRYIKSERENLLNNPNEIVKRHIK